MSLNLINFIILRLIIRFFTVSALVNEQVVDGSVVFEYGLLQALHCTHFNDSPELIKPRK